MAKYDLQREDVVLLLIDMQEKLLQAMKDKERVCTNTILLLKTAQQMRIPVIVVEQYPRGLGSTVPEIKSHLPEYEYIEKINFSAWGPQMQGILSRMAPRKTILVAGSETHVCVYQTVRDLLAEGFNIHVVREGVCSRWDENYFNALDLMKDMGAVINTTETIIFDLLQAGGTPDFKVISPLLK